MPERSPFRGQHAFEKGTVTALRVRIHDNGGIKPAGQFLRLRHEGIASKRLREIGRFHLLRIGAPRGETVDERLRERRQRRLMHSVDCPVRLCRRFPPEAEVEDIRQAKYLFQQLDIPVAGLGQVAGADQAAVTVRPSCTAIPPSCRAFSMLSKERTRSFISELA